MATLLRIKTRVNECLARLSLQPLQDVVFNSDELTGDLRLRAAVTLNRAYHRRKLRHKLTTDVYKRQR